MNCDPEEHDVVIAHVAGSVLTQMTVRMQIVTEYRLCGCVTWRQA